MKLPKSFTTVTKFSKALALIVFIAFPILGFFLGKYYQTSIFTTTQISSLSSDWKTYENTKDGYFIKYPNNFSISYGNQNDPNTYLNTGKSWEGIPISFNFTINQNPKKLSIQDLNKDFAQPESIKYTKSTLGKYTIYTAKFPSESVSLCKFITEDGTKYFTICLNPYEGDGLKYESIFNNILSTFKFTN